MKTHHKEKLLFCGKILAAIIIYPLMILYMPAILMMIGALMSIDDETLGWYVVTPIIIIGYTYLLYHLGFWSWLMSIVSPLF